MTSISITRRNAAGDPEDATTVTLSDSGAVYGLKRISDDVVIVAAGTATTNPSTGVYSYDTSALNLDSSERYQASWKIVKTGLPTQYVTTTIEAADQSATLRGLRRALGHALGRHDVLATTSAADASDPDATRTLICSTLINDDAATNAYEGCYLYVASGALAGQQRRMRNGGFTGVDGRLIARRPFTGIPASGVTFEICRVLPAIAEDGVNGLRECLNEALKLLHHPERLEFDAVSNEANYGIVSQPWLRHDQQVGVEFEPNTDSGVNPTANLNAARLRHDADTPQLEIPGAWYATGETFAVEVARPDFTFIKPDGGAWGNSTVGLQSDGDECLTDPTLAVETALYFAYKEIAKAARSEQEAATWWAKAEAQEKRAMRLREDRMPKLAPEGSVTAERPGWAVPRIMARLPGRGGSTW